MTADEPPPTHEASFNRQGRALGGIALTLFLGAATLAGVFLSIEGADSETLMTIVIVVFGLMGVGLIASLFVALRVHRWTLEASSLRIVERPRVPLTGRALRTTVPYGEIVALRRVEAGLDHLLELERQGGAVHRLAQKLVKPAGGGPRAVRDVAGLEAFEGAIRARMAAQGVAVPPQRLGLSLWNKPLGLAVLALVVVASAVLSVWTIHALWLGADVTGTKAKGAALIIILPIGALYFLVKSWRRRARVLGQP